MVKGANGEKGKVTNKESFGDVIRNRRRQLDMTQEEAARRIGTSVAYISHLEGRKRHPSAKVVIKLAKVLGFEPRELFLLANPQTETLISQQASPTHSKAWYVFNRDENLRRVHHITEQELEVLSRVAMMGEVRSPTDFIFILNSIRQALSK
jgi:transcriptional regulator with XRE-family HTH domain